MRILHPDHDRLELMVNLTLAAIGLQTHSALAQKSSSKEISWPRESAPRPAMTPAFW